jgi:GNAT superfamily N-acetyltransferase
MDHRAVLAAFDTQVRRRPQDANALIEQDHMVNRRMSPDGWTGVLWSNLDEASAGEVIDAQIRRFARQGRPWEWKHYSYDRPADLAERLVSRGFVAGHPETLMVAELANLDVTTAPPPGVVLRQVSTEGDAAVLVGLCDEVSGRREVDSAVLASELLTLLRRTPPESAGVLAMVGERAVGERAVGERAVGAGRVELPPTVDFASLWGGATLPAWRGRGIYRALVASRAATAITAGYRYLQVDASAASQPILARLGFAALATTTPFVHPGTAV